MKKALFVGAALLLTGLASAQAPAPMDLQIVFEGPASVVHTGAASAEYDGVTVTDDGSTVYLFDSIGAFDGILSFNGSFATFGTEAQVSGGTASASAGDMDIDAAGNVYVNAFDNIQNGIWVAPPAGFGTATRLVATASSVNLDELAVDRANSRLIIAYSDAFPPATAEDLVFVNLTTADQTPSVLATEATIEAALAMHPDYVDDTTNDLDPMDLCVQSDGDIILSHGFTSGNNVNGTLLRITSAGAASMFATSNFLITQAGGDPLVHNIGNVRVETLSDDQILVHCVFTATTGAVLDPFIGVLSADGSSFEMLATRTQLEGDSDVDADLLMGGSGGGAGLFFMDGKGGAVAANDDYYFYRQNNGTGSPNGNAVLRLAGIRAYLDAVASVPDWSLY